MNWLMQKVQVFHVKTVSGRTINLRIARLWLLLLTAFVFWKMIA